MFNISDEELETYYFLTKAEISNLGSHLFLEYDSVEEPGQYKCDKCNVILNLEYFIFYNGTGGNYKTLDILTCEQQIIKNIIE